MTDIPVGREFWRDLKRQIAQRIRNPSEAEDLLHSAYLRFQRYRMEKEVHDPAAQVAHAAFVEAFYTTFVYIGSAVVRSSQGGAFRALLGFHKLYSRILLRAAVSRLRRA